MDNNTYNNNNNNTNSIADDSDDEYLPSPIPRKPKKKPKSKKSKINRKRKIAETDINSTENPPTKKRKRGWSEEEKVKFTTGLEIFGRDWKQLSLYIGNNRNGAAMRSHAQIYFLKLLKARKPLPEKVKESGDGYTLSGRPLNKYSATVLKVFGSADNVPMDMGGVISDEEAAIKLKFKHKPKTEKKKPKVKERSLNINEKIRRSTILKHLYNSDDEDEDYKPTNVHLIQNTKLRRSKRERKTICHALHTSDPFGLRTDIELYDANAQPFQIKWCPIALLLANLHSHLCSEVEIMGLLAGTYDYEQRIVKVCKCYPLREEDQETQSVTADVEDYFRITQIVEQSDMQLVGWYHSHPHFENYPSNTDLMQHHMHKHENEESHPHIGLIISSWSSASVQSEYRWFNSVWEAKDVFTPMEFQTEMEVMADLNDDGLINDVKQLIGNYGGDEYQMQRCDLGEKWISVVDGMSNYCKIIGSLEAEISDVSKMERDVFIEQVKKAFLENINVWWVTNKPLVNVVNGMEVEEDNSKLEVEDNEERKDDEENECENIREAIEIL